MGDGSSAIQSTCVWSTVLEQLHRPGVCAWLVAFAQPQSFSQPYSAAAVDDLMQANQFENDLMTGFAS